MQNKIDKMNEIERINVEKERKNDKNEMENGEKDDDKKKSRKIESKGKLNGFIHTKYELSLKWNAY